MQDKIIELLQEELDILENEMLALGDMVDLDDVDTNSFLFKEYQSKFLRAVEISKKLDEISDFMDWEHTGIGWY